MACVVPIIIDVTPPTPPVTTPSVSHIPSFVSHVTPQSTPSASQCQQMIPIVFVSFDDDDTPGFSFSFRGQFHQHLYLSCAWKFNENGEYLVYGAKKLHADNC